MKYNELHIHLLGAISQELTIELLSKYSNTPPQINKKQEKFISSNNFGKKLLQHYNSYSPKEYVKQLRTFKNLQEFLSSYVLTSSLIRTRDDFRLLVASVTEQLKLWDVQYAEITFSPSLYTHKEICLEDIAQTLSEAKESSLIPVHWLLDPVRNLGGEHALLLLNSLTEIDRSLLTGAGLAGDETSCPITEFKKYFIAAKSMGLGTTCHVGEGKISKEIGLVLEYPIDRLGHCVALVDRVALGNYATETNYEANQELLVKIVEKNIPIEVCVSSNLQTKTVMQIDHHPIREFLNIGVPVCISSDDPFFFKTTIAQDYSSLIENKIITQDELKILMQNSEDAKFSKE